MNIVLIEEYKGHKIQFICESERFTFDMDSGNYTERQSYAACKKAIDDLYKQNLNFEPFRVIDRNNGNIFDIVGIRKDFDFTILRNDSKQRLSSYEDGRYRLYVESDDIVFANIKALEKSIAEIENQIYEERQKLQGEELKSIKDKYIKSAQ